MTSPHNIQGKIAQAAFHAVGQLTVQWTTMEFALDALATTIFEYFDGAKFERKLPFKFSSKTKFLRKAFSETEELGELNDNVLSSLDRLDSLAEIRNGVIHGFLLQYFPDTQKYLFVSLRRIEGGKKFQVHNQTLTALELLEAGVEANLIGTDIARVCAGLLIQKAGAVELKKVLEII